jgi:hypothetical protein
MPPFSLSTPQSYDHGVRNTAFLEHDNRPVYWCSRSSSHGKATTRIGENSVTIDLLNQNQNRKRSMEAPWKQNGSLGEGSRKHGSSQCYGKLHQTALNLAVRNEVTRTKHQNSPGATGFMAPLRGPEAILICNRRTRGKRDSGSKEGLCNVR